MAWPRRGWRGCQRGGNVLGDGVGDAKPWHEARGSKRVAPVGDERAERHDDERPSGSGVILWRLDPKRHERQPGQEEECGCVLHRRERGEGWVRGQPCVCGRLNKEANATLEGDDAVGVAKCERLAGARQEREDRVGQAGEGDCERLSRGMSGVLLRLMVRCHGRNSSAWVGRARGSKTDIMYIIGSEGWGREA